MSIIPQHNAMTLQTSGVLLRRINTLSGQGSDIHYPHQDDYFIFGLVEKGVWCSLIDFDELNFYPGDIFIIQPGQIHSFIKSEQMEGWLLFADTSLINNSHKHLLDSFSLSALSFRADEKRIKELTQIAFIIQSRTDGCINEYTTISLRRLTEVFISIVCEILNMQDMRSTHHSRRHIEIVLLFRQLLKKHLIESHQPSYYASLLNISTVYLNEVIKKICGMSVSAYIKKEIVIQAKRFLVHSHLSIKEIAVQLGIDDHAYFSRLFTQATGLSPTAFRKQNLG